MSAVAGVRRALLGAALRTGRAVLRNPRLKLLARRVLQHFPALRTRAQDWMYRTAMSAQLRAANSVQGDADLSPRTLHALRALQQAAERDRPA